MFRQIDEFGFHTWADDLRQQLLVASRDLALIETNIENVRPGETYGVSYVPTECSKTAWATSFAFCDMLLSYIPSNGLVLLKDLTFEGFGSRALHGLFSLASLRLRQLDRGNQSALHSPIEPDSTGEEFPVHADLYGPRMLFNVITEHDFDGGDITLLSRCDLIALMSVNELMPTAAKNQIVDVLSHPRSTDRFESTFSLMYGNHPWSVSLKRSIEAAQLRIPGAVGIGYLTVDGMWLHGRTQIYGPVSPMRVQRLVYDNADAPKQADASFFARNDKLSTTIMRHKSLKAKALKIA